MTTPEVIAEMGRVPPPPPPPPSRPKPKLPPNWYSTKDASGETYYYNSVTNETQWHLPLEVSLKDRSVEMQMSQEPSLITTRANSGNVEKFNSEILSVRKLANVTNAQLPLGKATDANVKKSDCDILTERDGSLTKPERIVVMENKTRVKIVGKDESVNKHLPMNHSANVRSSNTISSLIIQSANVRSSNTVSPLVNTCMSANVGSVNTIYPFVNHSANARSANKVYPVVNQSANVGSSNTVSPLFNPPTNVRSTNTVSPLFNPSDVRSTNTILSPLVHPSVNVGSSNTVSPLVNPSTNVGSSNTVYPLVNQSTNVRSVNTVYPLVNQSANVGFVKKEFYLVFKLADVGSRESKNLQEETSGLATISAANTAPMNESANTAPISESANATNSTSTRENVLPKLLNEIKVVPVKRKQSAKAGTLTETLLVNNTASKMKETHRILPVIELNKACVPMKANSEQLKMTVGKIGYSASITDISFEKVLGSQSAPVSSMDSAPPEREKSPTGKKRTLDTSTLPYETCGKLAKWDCDLDTLIQIHSSHPPRKQVQYSPCNTEPAPSNTELAPSNIEPAPSNTAAAASDTAPSHSAPWPGDTDPGRGLSNTSIPSSVALPKRKIFKCKDCDKTFKGVVGLRKHIGTKGPIPVSSSTDNRVPLSVFKCKDCDKTYTIENCLLHHIGKVHTAFIPQKRYEYSECDASFYSNGQLANHMRSHDVLKFKCDQCDASFLNGRQFTTHMRRHDEVKVKCDQCEESFKSIGYLNVHKKKSHPVEEKFKCEVCGFSFKTQGALRQHSKKHAVANARGEKKCHASKTCKICTISFPEPDQLERHNFEVHPSSFCFKCNKCKRAFAYRNKFKAHDCPQEHECMRCGQMFETKLKLKSHKRLHKREKHYKCTICTISFPKPDQLERHNFEVHPSSFCFKCNKCKRAFASRKKFKAHDCPQEHECTWCGQMFETKLKLKSHKRLHTKEKPYKCFHCKKCFRHIVAFRRHKLTHADVEKVHKCQSCAKAFHNKEDLVIHKRTHTGFAPYRCSCCEESFISCVSRDRHCKAAHDVPLHSKWVESGRFKCRECGKLFKAQYIFRHHIRVHAGVKPFKCKFCEKGFLKLDKRDRHELIHTGEKPFKCKFCERAFNNDGNLLTHVLAAHELADSKHKCSLCDKIFISNYTLKQHEYIHTGEKPFKCSICDKEFHVKQALVIHKRIHTGEKPFKCFICNKEFRLKTSLIIHERIHTGEKPFKCSICNKEFRVKQALVFHERIHTGEKPFKCSICNKEFRVKQALGIHERIHTGEKPFKCSICNKEFRVKQSSIIHKRIHTGEKPFKCSICNKEFRLKTSLIIHERIHTREKPFKCSICDKEYRLRTSWFIHERFHTGEKPFLCCHCGKGFANSSRCKAHERIHAREKTFTCSHCAKQFYHEHRLKLHEKIHRDGSRCPTTVKRKEFQCSLCEKSFNDRAKLVEHEKIHGEKNPLDCVNYDLCSEVFTSKASLLGHQSSCTLRRSHEEACSAAVGLENEVNQANNMGEVLYFECPSCKKLFERISGLQEHDCTPINIPA